MTSTYHDGSRRLQDRFDSRRLADRLDEKIVKDAFLPRHRRRPRPARLTTDETRPTI